MKHNTRTILQELLAHPIAGENRVHDAVNTSGEQIIISAIHFLEKLETSFDDETAADLKKRFLNSIKTSDVKKFKRGVVKAKKSRDASTNFDPEL